MIRYLVKRIPNTSLERYDGSRYYCEIAGGTAEKSTVETAELLAGSKYLDVQTGTWYVYDELTDAWAISMEGGSADPEVIEAAVQAWLTAHPEATTTVQDGSISYAKLDTAMKAKADAVSTLSDEIDEITDYKTPENIFDKDTMVQGNNYWWEGSNPVAATVANGYSAIKIPIDNPGSVSIKQILNVGDVSLFRWDAVDANMVRISFAKPSANIENGYTISDIPSNAKYLLLSILYYAAAVTEGNYLSVVVGETAKNYTPYFSPHTEVVLANKSVSTEKIEDGAITNSKIASGTIRNLMYITKETDDTNLLLKMLDAFNAGNTDVFFEKSTYTLSEAYVYMWDTLVWRWGDGLPVGNGCRYFFNDSTIISNPPANPPEGSNGERNVLDCRTRGSDYEVHDVTLINNGGRYCIHDEGNNSTIPYCHKYENVTMIYNKTSLTPDTGAKAFGCGTGFDATLIFDGCIFRNENGQATTPMAIHAPTTNPNEDPCKLHLIMKDSYINQGTIYINVFDGTRDTVDFFLFGNLFGETFSDPIVNLIANNNNVIGS